jgi:hypothetical protein
MDFGGEDYYNSSSAGLYLEEPGRLRRDHQRSPPSRGGGPPAARWAAPDLDNAYPYPEDGYYYEGGAPRPKHTRRDGFAGSRPPYPTAEGSPQNYGALARHEGPDSFSAWLGHDVTRADRFGGAPAFGGRDPSRFGGAPAFGGAFGCGKCGAEPPLLQLVAFIALIVFAFLIGRASGKAASGTAVVVVRDAAATATPASTT